MKSTEKQLINESIQSVFMAGKMDDFWKREKKILSPSFTFVGTTETVFSC